MLFADGRMRDVLVWIPARGGSKGLLRKALRDLGGKPLIAWTIEHALSVACADYVMVNTDDPEIAAVARAHGAQVPFLRPKRWAGDRARLEKVFLHQYRWFYYARKGRYFDISVNLSPTCPFRREGLIAAALQKLCACAQADSIRSVLPLEADLDNYWLRRDGGFQRLEAATAGEGKETVFYRNAFSFSASFHFRAANGGRGMIYPINEVESIDVDYMSDLVKSRMVLQHGITWQHAPVHGDQGRIEQPV